MIEPPASDPIAQLRWLLDKYMLDMVPDDERFRLAIDALEQERAKAAEKPARAVFVDPYEAHKLRGAIDFLRENIRNDGAEGESVHLVCDALAKKLLLLEDLSVNAKRMNETETNEMTARDIVFAESALTYLSMKLRDVNRLDAPARRAFDWLEIVVADAKSKEPQLALADEPVPAPDSVVERWRQTIRDREQKELDALAELDEVKAELKATQAELKKEQATARQHWAAYVGADAQLASAQERERIAHDHRGRAEKERIEAEERLAEFLKPAPTVEEIADRLKELQDQHGYGYLEIARTLRAELKLRDSSGQPKKEGEPELSPEREALGRWLMTGNNEERKCRLLDTRLLKDLQLEPGREVLIQLDSGAPWFFNVCVSGSDESEVIREALEKAERHQMLEDARKRM